MATVLITGGGRGIGFELAKQMSQLPASRISKIFVTTRGDPSAQLSDLMKSSGGKVDNILCNAVDDASVAKAAKELESKLDGAGLDILVNNIGEMPFTPGGVQDMTASDLLKTFDVNVGTAHRMTAALIPLVRKSSEKKIVFVSTTVGAISHARRFVQTSTPRYKITKAALNMLMVQYALQFEDEGFTIVAVSPGWLKTDMGSQYADLDVDVGVNATKDVILSADAKKNGKFLNIHVPGWEHAEGPNQYDGAEAPW